MKHMSFLGVNNMNNFRDFFFWEKPHRNMLCQIRTSGFSVFFGGWWWFDKGPKKVTSR